MKRYLPLIITVTFFSLISLSVQAQCKGFAKNICRQELMPYIHDGNYHAAILTEGEEAELYKTFYSDQEYRIAICGSEALPPIHFKIVDHNRKVLYDNADHDYAITWDFSLESSQQLKILVNVPVREEATEEIVSGCVSIMFGFKTE